MSAAAAGELGPQGAVAGAAGPQSAFKAAGQPPSAAPTQQPPRQGHEPFTQQVRRRFGRGAGQYEQEARLQQAMAWRLARLCADLPLPSGPRADLGAGTGLLSRALQSHHPELRQRPPLQLDLCPELLARNPLARLSGPPAGRDGHNDLHSELRSRLLNERRGTPSSDLCGELPSDLLSDGAHNGAADHGPGGPAGQASGGQAFGSHDPVIGHAEGSHPGDSDACDSDASDSPSSASQDNASRDSSPNGLIWDLNDGLPDALSDAALLASSFALQWLEDPAGSLERWCRRLGPGGWLVLAVPTAGSFPQWRQAAARAGVPCTALALPEADALRQAARSSGLRLRHDQRLRFSRPRQGGLPTLRHLQRLGASASTSQALSTGQLRRLLAHWPAASPLTWEVLLLIAQRQA